MYFQHWTCLSQQDNHYYSSIDWRCSVYTDSLGKVKIVDLTNLSVYKSGLPVKASYLCSSTRTNLRASICISTAFRLISTQENFSQKENFVKCDLVDTNFPSEKNFEVENFQLLTMIFSENFLSVEIFLEWKWAFRQTIKKILDNPGQTSFVHLVKI
jgi:hypothetical protein